MSFVYRLIVERCIISDDTIPELSTCWEYNDLEDIDCTWKYWEEHSHVVFTSSNLKNIMFIKKSLEDRSVAGRELRQKMLLDDTLRRGYRLLVTVETSGGSATES